MENLNQWLMLAANLGVLAGMFILAYEIHQNSDALISASRQGLLESDLAILHDFYEHPEVYGTTYHPEARGNPEQLRLEIYFIGVMRTREFAWQQYRRGLLDEETFMSYMAPAISIFNSGPGKDFITRGGYAGDGEFIAYLKSLLE